MNVTDLSQDTSAYFSPIYHGLLGTYPFRRRIEIRPHTALLCDLMQSRSSGYQQEPTSLCDRLLRRVETTTKRVPSAIWGLIGSHALHHLRQALV